MNSSKGKCDSFWNNFHFLIKSVVLRSSRSHWSFLLLMFSPHVYERFGSSLLMIFSCLLLRWIVFGLPVIERHFFRGQSDILGLDEERGQRKRDSFHSKAREGNKRTEREMERKVHFSDEKNWHATMLCILCLITACDFA